MQDFTFINPEKYERVSFPNFLKEFFKNLNITTEDFTFVFSFLLKLKDIKQNIKLCSHMEEIELATLKKLMY